MNKQKYKAGDLITRYHFENGNNKKIFGLIVEMCSQQRLTKFGCDIFKDFYWIYVDCKKELISLDELESNWDIIN